MTTDKEFYSKFFDDLDYLSRMSLGMSLRELHRIRAKSIGARETARQSFYMDLDLICRLTVGMTLEQLHTARKGLEVLTLRQLKMDQLKGIR